jgi:hypothetical protein
MEQMQMVGLIIAAIAGLGVVTAYVVAGPTLKRVLHRGHEMKPSV